MVVQRKKVQNTVDGGSSLTFVTGQDNSTQAAKIFLLPEDVNIKLTVEVIDGVD